MTQVYDQINRMQESQQPTIDGSSDLTISGTSELQSTLEDAAKDSRVMSFKCASCGLSHGHDTDKHRASDSFDAMSEDDTNAMDSNPNCHCGVNELGRRGSDFGVSEASASGTARMAPIPDSEARAMDAKYGSLA